MVRIVVFENKFTSLTIPNNFLFQYYFIHTGSTINLNKYVLIGIADATKTYVQSERERKKPYLLIFNSISITPRAVSGVVVVHKIIHLYSNVFIVVASLLYLYADVFFYDRRRSIL